MSTKFFTNQDGNSLFSKLSGIASDMENFHSFLAVAGFFRASGYFKLRKQLGDVQELRIIIGIDIDNVFFKHNRNNDGLLREEKNELTQEYIDKLRADISKTQYSAEVEDGLLQMVEDLRTGRLQMRIHDEHNLHAKFYLCLPQNFSPNSDGWVIMGSSNISNSGLGLTQPPRYELNVAMKDYDDVEFCRQEFERLWSESHDITSADLTETLPPSDDKMLTPYEIYVKVLIDVFGKLVEDVYNPIVPAGLMRIQYQLDAARQGYQMMMRYNGFFLADVVGTGKTIMAAYVAQHFVHDNGENTRILIVCPPAVMTNWEETMNWFKLRRFTHIVSNGSLSYILDDKKRAKKNFLPADEYDLVIVDEAHNFRNGGTDRFDLLQQICKRQRRYEGGVKGLAKRIVLVSATPLNNGPEDLCNLIKLFQDENNLTIDGVGNNINVLFKPWIDKYNIIKKNRRDKKHKKSNIDEISILFEEIRSVLLEKILLRRTRHNLERYYADDLRKQGIRFPKLLPPIEHGYDLDQNTADLFARTIAMLTDGKVRKDEDDYDEDKVFDGDVIGSLTYARYRAIEFLNDDKKKKFKSAESISANLAIIYRTLMVKRLESSFEAFRKSMDTLKRTTDHMITMYEKNQVIIAPDAKIKERLERGDKIEKIIADLDKEGRNQDDYLFTSDDFKPEYIEMLRADSKMIEEYSNLWKQVVTDPKLEEFVRLIKTDLFNRENNPTGKLVVFSESVDTATYLTEQLTQRLNRNDILNINASNRDQKEEVIRQNFDANYSPKSNEYNIIITSDVLAEGINLHRANVIANYDSPWNATKLMQRVGRVNRIGSVANAIFSHMFYPSHNGENIIGLVSLALIRLQAFHSALGEDEKVFNHDEMVCEFELFNSDKEDSSDLRLALLMELQDIYNNHRSLYERLRLLPDRSRTMRHSADAKTKGSTVVHIKNGEKSQFYHVVGDEALPIDFVDAAAIFRATQTEMPIAFAPVRARHFQQVNAAVEHYAEVLRQVQDTNTVQNHATDKNLQTAVSHLRRLKRAFADNAAAIASIALVESYVVWGVYSELTMDVVRENRRINGLIDHVQDLRPTMLDKLNRWVVDYHLVPRVVEPVKEEQSTGYVNPQIITSETFD